MDVDINLEPGPGGSDKDVESKNQADSATEIPKTSRESMKVVKINFRILALDLTWIPRSRTSLSIRHRQLCYQRSYWLSFDIA